MKNKLKRFGIKDYKSLAMPLNSNNKLSRNINTYILEKVEIIKEVLYKILANSLIYAIIGI